MRPQDKSQEQQDSDQESRRNGDQDAGGGDATSGAGASGEGAKSALDAMLKRRQMGIHPPAQSGASVPAQPPGDSKAGE